MPICSVQHSKPLSVAGSRRKISLAAFAAAFEAAKAAKQQIRRSSREFATRVTPPPDDEEASSDYSGEARGVVAAAVDRLVDYQDGDYGRNSSELWRFREFEQRHGDGSHRLLVEVARQLALGMATKTPCAWPSSSAAGAVLPGCVKRRRSLPVRFWDSEFFHPRVQEIADTLPAAAGDWLMRTDWARRLVERGLRGAR